MLPRKVGKQIGALVEQHPSEVMEALLRRPFWPKDVITQARYSRVNDDSKAILSVAFSPDSDGWIDVFALEDPKEPGGSMRFRTHAGGGVSPHTRNALLILAAAIRLDELEHPLERGPLLGKKHA